METDPFFIVESHSYIKTIKQRSHNFRCIVFKAERVIMQAVFH